MKPLIPHKTYRCVFCGLRMPGSKFVEHAKTHQSAERTEVVHSTKICAACGKPFTVKHSSNLKRQKTCGIKCGHALITFTPEQRVEAFWKKVQKGDGCWIWTGAHDRYGYGLFAIKTGKRDVGTAHRFAWQVVKGEIPAGLHVLHKCDNPGCVNPEHLSLGTHQTNMDEMTARGRRNLFTRSKLKVEDVVAIRSEYRIGPGRTNSNVHELAAKYGVKAHTITNIAAGRTFERIK